MSKKQLTLLLALASAACTYNNASYASDEGDEDAVEDTTKKSKPKASAKKAEGSGNAMLIRTAVYTGVIGVAGLFDMFVGAAYIRGKITFGAGWYAPVLIFGLLLAVLSVAAVFIEDMICECDEKGDYDLPIRVIFYLAAMSLGAAMFANIVLGDSNGVTVFSKSLSDKDGALYKYCAKYYGLHVIFVAIFGGIEAFVESLVSGGAEGSKKKK